MLLTENVEVGLNAQTISYYENLGYHIPKERYRGRDIVKKNTKIIVKVKDLQSSSNVRVQYRCESCNEIITVRYTDYYRRKDDKYKNYCPNCRENDKYKGCKENHKRCIKCERELPITRDYYQEDSKHSEGFSHICLECMGRKFFPSKAPKLWSEDDIKIIEDNYADKTINEIISMLSVKRTYKAVLHIAQKLKLHKINNIVEGYNEVKYKVINNTWHKYCKCCNRYLPFSFDYFPKDNKCSDGLRNVCRECKGENFRINSNIHKWTKEETELLIEKYPHMTNKELYEVYFNHLSISKILHRGNDLKLYKTEETLKRTSQEVGDFHSQRLLDVGKWKNESNPQYNSQRFGELNPNYKGGISELCQELRRNIKQWKLDSAENCNYKCFFSKERFDNIHHLYSFNSIVEDTLSELELPLYENISLYSNEELLKIINKCIEIHYRYPLGICLSEKYHAKFHMEYGYGNNTPEQFYKFVENYYKGKYKDLKEVG